MSNFGDRIQFEIYRTMADPSPERLPVSYEERERQARGVLEDGPYYCIAGGAGSGQTMEIIGQFSILAASFPGCCKT